MKASIAIQVLPVASNQDETLRIIDEVIAYIKSSGLHCHVGPFETTIEGESYDQLMDIVKGCQHVAVRPDLFAIRFPRGNQGRNHHSRAKTATGGVQSETRVFGV